MSLEHLHYAIKEIDTVSQLLLIENTTFFKRSLTRLIAVRTDDFIKLGFVANKQTVNLKTIKDDLNALKSLYEDHFKTQRDKYGAHVQHLDFGDRLKFWSELDADKAIFFTDLPREIYTKFSAVPAYIPYVPGAIDMDTALLIKEVNNKFNLELFPNLSTDILALTRPNSGGMLNFSMIHTKAGVLKSLELLIDYEIAQIETLKDNIETKRLFIKLFITDLLSYVDNYFTRTDLAITAAQYEEGFDYYIRQSVGEGTSDANDILQQFITNVTLSEHIDELRRVRNKACGHIDSSMAVTRLDTMVDEIDLSKFNRFYLRLKNVFRSICNSVIFLKQYLIDPFEPLHGVELMTALDVTSFDGQPFPETPSRFKSLDDEDEYESHFKLWLDTEDGAARSYFWSCFIHAELLENIQIEIKHPSGSSTYQYLDYRKVHHFFETKLLDDTVPREEKLYIISLFISCRSGHPDTLAFILGRTYPSAFNLQCQYIDAIGRLSSERSAETLQRCIEIFRKGNLQGKCLALRAILGIDISARRSMTGQHDAEVSDYSDYIKEAIAQMADPLEKLSISLVLLSDFLYGGHHIATSLNGLYRTFFETEFIAVRKQIVLSYSIETDTRELNDVELLKNNRFITLVGVFSDFMEERGDTNKAKLFRTLVAQDYIVGCRTDNHELHNLAVIFYKIGDLVNAISVAKFLTVKNAQVANHNLLLLDLYRHDQKYKDDFALLKTTILQTFNLSDDERTAFESIEMD